MYAQRRGEEEDGWVDPGASSSSRSLFRSSFPPVVDPVHKSATKERCRSFIVNIASRVMEENLVVCVLSEGRKFGFFLFCDAEVATGKRGEEEM
ncbi:unnamed protein product [Sphagnum jensenii]